MDAAAIRAVLRIVHPTFAAVAALIPGGKVVDELIFTLAEKPGVLEEILMVLHLGGNLPSTARAPVFASDAATVEA